MILPKAMFYLLKGDSRVLGFKAFSYRLIKSLGCGV